MPQSLQLGNPNRSAEDYGMKRLNRLPLFLVIGIVVVFLVVLFYGLSSRGLRPGERSSGLSGSNLPAASFAEQMKRGVKDGIIGERDQEPRFKPTPVPRTRNEERQVEEARKRQPLDQHEQEVDADEEWRTRLQREQQEQMIREQQRQRMASLQAQGAAHDAPLKIDVGEVDANATQPASAARPSSASSASGPDLYAAALGGGINGLETDQNGQRSKEGFLNADIREAGYLPNRVIGQQSRFELKRGSVVPATMLTGINSDLPGSITAQVSQNVYDSATGHYLLIPQGTRLFGRYDSKVSFGQNRVLVLWTDLIFPNGSTLQIGGMAGTDQEGYGGFADKVDRHTMRIFGSAALVALIGTGIDMALPESSTLATQDTASDAARRNFAEVFGRVAEQTISKNLNVQPTIRIRPGYRFNLLVEQDIVFPDQYGG